MTYVIDDLTNNDWLMVYCNSNTIYEEITNEEIAKAMANYIYIGKFDKNEHSNIGDFKINNDEKVFILKDGCGSYKLFQVGCKVSDCMGRIVPNLYYIREIGILF